WDTGRVASDETLHIEYTGKPLASGMACWWKLKIWTTALGSTEQECAWSKPAVFSIGLLDEADWQTQWITTPEFLPDTPKHIGYMSKLTNDPDEPKWVQIDLGKSRRFDRIGLYPAVGRRGDVPPGGEIPPGDGFPLRFMVEVSDREDMSGSRMVADYSGSDIKNPGKEAFLVPVNKARGRYVRLTAVKHGIEVDFQRGGYLLKLAQLEVLRGEENIAMNCAATALDSYEDIPEGYGISLLTNGKKTYDPGVRRHIRPSPLLRGEFNCSKPVRRAIAYATALGNYELYINGIRIGDHFLSPGYTQYDKRVAVQAYDVTTLLQQGNNAAGAILGDGWYRVRYRLDGHDQFKDFVQGRFGDAIPRFLMQVQIEYEDGTKAITGTDEGWKYTLEGPYRRTSMYDGVEYDARREMPGWTRPGFSGENWASAIVSQPSWNPVKWPQTVQPIRVVKEITPVSVNKTTRGTWLVDFGQGVGGVCRVTLNGPEGMTVKLHHVMAVNPDGTLYTRSLWGAYNNSDTYTLKGKGPQTFEAPFTFYGFRFVEISGMESAENLVDIKALMISDEYQLTARMNTSDERLNKLWNIVELSYLSCLKGVMVDVADRDERWGWMGDCGTVHTQSQAYIFDMPAYFRKRCLDLMDDQWEDGYFPPKSPEMEGGEPSAVWSDAALTHAWSSWLNYGNKRLLKEMYPSIRHYVLMLKSKYESGKALWPFHFGDWLSSHMTIRPGATDWSQKGPAQLPRDLLQMIALIQNARLLRKIAGVLGNIADVAMLEKFLGTLMNDATITGIRELPPVSGAQTAYALSIGWEASTLDETVQLMDRLQEAIEAYDRHLTTGTLSTTTLLKVLSENDRHDLAWHLAMKPEFPSFGFMIEQDARAMWERFDTWIPGMGYNPDPMNGLNHMGFCSVGEWIFQTVSGIIPDPANPAYQQFLIEPRITGPVKEAETAYHSVRGKICSSWKIENGKGTLELIIPPNTKAIVKLPVSDPDSLKESGSSLSGENGSRLIRMTGNIMEFEVLSGKYS
ncbi:MAG: family 78 glycoside hydrolase catalytic domain, partial [Bacteroidales bacterium]|nr:family 78 glycoside hydrolase catalytic domain [Bacteroidales bacterium]